MNVIFANNNNSNSMTIRDSFKYQQSRGRQCKGFNQNPININQNEQISTIMNTISIVLHWGTMCALLQVYKNTSIIS